MADTLTREAIRAYLTTRFVGQRLEVYEEIDSTNDRAVALARDGAPNGTVVLAELQTKGRGRLGRRWFAPPGTSLLLSVVLRPDLAARAAQRTTMICSLAAVEAIAEVGETLPQGGQFVAQVKWPNDILLSGKKVGGVLTELGLRGERLDYAVVGMGLNVNLDVSALPQVMTPATSIMAEVGQPVSRLDLLIALLERIETYAERLSAAWSPHEAWRGYLATLGQHVRVNVGQEVIEGVAEDVDEDGALLVRTRTGELSRIVVGDVTLRG